MRTALLKRAWRALGQAYLIPQSRNIIVMIALGLTAANVSALPTANWVSGGPNPAERGVSRLGAGYVNGDITLEAAYHTPCGIAMDISGNYLLVADRDNNTIRVLDFYINQTGTLLTYTNQNINPTTNLFSKPVGVAIDDLYNIFVLNRGKGTNGTVLEFDYTGELIATNISRLTNAAAIALDLNDNIYVTASNTVFRISSLGVISTVATIASPGASLQGIVVKHNGLLAVCDTGRNGILLIDPNTGLVTTNAGFHGAGDFITINDFSYSNAATFFQPVGVAESGDGTLVVTDFSNHRVKAVLASGIVTNVYGVQSNYWSGTFPGLSGGTAGTDSGTTETVQLPDSKVPNANARMPFGVTFAPDGSIYVSEDYYHIIRHITGAGFLPPPPPTPSAPLNLTAVAGYGQVTLTWSSSTGATNYNIKHSLSSGGPYTTIASTTATILTYTDTNVVDGTTNYYVVSAGNSSGDGANSAEANAVPLFSPAPTILLPVTTNFNLITLNWTTSVGATAYNVKRSTSAGTETTIATQSGTSYTDTSVLNGTTYYYVISALNGGGESPNSLEVSATPPIPPPPAPIIGWFDYEGNFFNGFFTVLHPVSGINYYTAHNDVLLAIAPGTNGIQTYYIVTNGPQPVLAIPGPTNGTTPPPYQDGLSPVVPSLPVTTVPDMVIKAVSVGPGGSSPISTAEFVFQVANPTILGNNGAQFTVSDITTNVTVWYTIDGSVPTNAPPSIGPISITNGSVVTLSINVATNILFQARAFRNGYQPSGIAVQYFSPDAFVPNSISFGFFSGEASSAFVASPGQVFYAPVTLTTLSGAALDQLQFTLSVNSAGASVPVASGAYEFISMLMEPDLDNPGLLKAIPPYMFINYFSNPPPGPPIHFNGTNFVSLLTTDLSLNQIAVGWLERQGQTNLFNTLSQNLLTMSLAHDDLFPTASQPNGVIVGSYAFQVPANAVPGDTYQIQIGRPSGTINGIGFPGDSVFIYAPTNGSLGAGSINAIKNVVVGQKKYIAGDSAPFNWFNAGDFGDTNLLAPDVAQVFEAAVYGLNTPPAGSDLFDSMDSCGFTYSVGAGGYLVPNAFANPNLIFNGNDATIDSIAFGDGVLDVADVYVTYRRSEFTNLLWFQRYWTNDVAHGVSGRVAEIVPNVFNPQVVAKALSGPKSLVTANDSSSYVSVTNQPRVIFTAGDCQTNAGRTIQIPITATIFGTYPLRTLMLNLSVVPLDGSPALTSQVGFSYNPALGTPYKIEQRGNGNYSAVWLNNDISGLSNNVTIGTLTITLPANATSLSAYAVHFDHASASPNGLASFPRQTRPGLITFSNRSGSSYGDGIPDSWRLRYFLTLDNLLSQTNADADGDGMNNLQEYLAGTDPTDPASCFKNISPNPDAAQQPSDCVINWPSAIGKQYVIERTLSLSTPFWTTIATNSGTGTTMEFHDTSGGGLRFYRVRVQ